MSQIDPTTRSVGSGVFLAPSLQHFDQASMLLALSVLQIDVLRQAFVAQIGQTRDKEQQLSRVARVVASAGAMHASIVNQEIQSISNMLKPLFQIQAAGRAVQQPNSADNDRFQDSSVVRNWHDTHYQTLQRWGKPRDLHFKPWANPASGSTSLAGVARKFVQRVKRLAIIEQNVRRIQAYLHQVLNGAARNQALERLVQESPHLQPVLAALATVGFTAGMRNLGDVFHTVRALNQRLNLLHNGLRLNVAQLHELGSMVNEKSQQISQLTADTQKEQSRQARQRDRRQTQQLEQALRELEEAGVIESEMRKDLIAALMSLDDIEFQQTTVEEMAASNLFRTMQESSWQAVAQQFEQWRSELTLD